MTTAEILQTIPPREKEIVGLLLEGCSTKEMAGRLGIQQRTVKSYLNKLFIKFGVSSGIKRVKLASMLYREIKQIEEKEELKDDKNT